MVENAPQLCLAFLTMLFTQADVGNWACSNLSPDCLLLFLETALTSKYNELIGLFLDGDTIKHNTPQKLNHAIKFIR